MITEKEMTNYFRGLLNNSNKVWFEEFEILGKRVDVVAIDLTEKHIIAMELKIKDWKKGLKQCIANQLFSNEVYLAVWHEFAHRAPIKEFKEKGVGIMAVSANTIEVLLEARWKEIDSKKIMEIVKVNGRSVGDILVEREMHSL
jgi:hypothetical protein